MVYYFFTIVYYYYLLLFTIVWSRSINQLIHHKWAKYLQISFWQKWQQFQIHTEVFLLLVYFTLQWSSKMDILCFRNIPVSFLPLPKIAKQISMDHFGSHMQVIKAIYILNWHRTSQSHTVMIAFHLRSVLLLNCNRCIFKNNEK